MKTLLITLILLSAIGSASQAQQAGSSSEEKEISSTDVPEVNLYDTKSFQPKIYPIRHHKNGSIQYPYGHSSLLLKAKPLHLSLVKLQAGENVLSLAAGDTKRWIIRKAFKGTSGHVTPIIEVKPIAYGIQTNMVITTNRRVYNIKLVSAEKGDTTFMRQISFYYKASKPFKTIGRSPRIQKQALGTIKVESINTGYKVREGKYGFPWRPESIWDDGHHIYIKIPDKISAQQLPVLYKVDNVGGRHIINTVYNPSTRILKTDRLFKKGVLQYNAKKDRFLRSDKIKKELFIIREKRSLP